MNKYSSGYAAIYVISLLGGVIVVASIICGLAVLVNSPPGMGYVGWSIVIGGSVQGLILIGMGAIGSAILDGANYQARALEKLEYIEINTRREKQESETPPELSGANSSQIKVGTVRYSPKISLEDELNNHKRNTDDRIR